jgi:hypothetical protein
VSLLVPLFLMALSFETTAHAVDARIVMKSPKSLSASQGWLQRWLALSARNFLNKAGYGAVHFHTSLAELGALPTESYDLFWVGSSSDWREVSPSLAWRAVENSRRAVISERYREGWESSRKVKQGQLTFVSEDPEHQALFFPRLFATLGRTGGSLASSQQAARWASQVKEKYLSSLSPLREGERSRIRVRESFPKWWSGALSFWLAPPVSLREAKDTSPQLERALAFPSWEYLTDVFPSDLRDLPGRIGESPEQVWLEGEGLRYLLGSLVEVGGSGVVERFLKELLGVRLRQVEQRVESWIFLQGSTEALLKSQDDAADGELWAVRLPETARFGIQILEDGKIRLDALSREPGKSVELKIRLPYIPDGVYLRGAEVSLANGDASVEAGIFGNRLAVVAKVNLFAQRLKEIDFWASVQKNLDALPPLRWVFDQWFSSEDSTT